MKLSKREIVMLTFLILLGLFFVEYRFVIVPSITQYDELTQQVEQVKAQVDLISLTIATSKNLAQKRDDNLTAIQELSAPFIDEIKPDALLAYTHELVLKHELILEAYGPSTVLVNQLTPEQATAQQLTYDLKTLVNQYQLIDQTTPTPAAENTDQDTGTGSAEGRFLEKYNIVVNVKGTYSQIYAFIQDVQSLNRSIMISKINIQPTSEQGAIPDQGVVLGVEIWLDYYGITKIVKGDEPINVWNRPAVTGKIDDPFYDPSIIAVPTPTPEAEATPTPEP